MIKISKDISNISFYSGQPKDKEELIQIIWDRISKEGPNCDLNDIDTSIITNMSFLFDTSSWFNGDISRWDVSNVKYMDYMFSGSIFNGDISDWDVSNVKNMEVMFHTAAFKKDISNWKINKDCYVDSMFIACPIKEEFKPKLLRI